MELTYLLVVRAEDDIPNAEQIRKILKDLRETRQAKSRAGLTVLDDKWLGVRPLYNSSGASSLPFFL